MYPVDWEVEIRKYSRGFYFRETSHMRSFVKIKSSRNGEITLPFTDKVANFHFANMSFNVIHENKVLAKIYVFTVVLALFTITQYVCNRGRAYPNTTKRGNHHRPTSETPFKWRFAGGPMMASHGMLAL